MISALVLAAGASRRFGSQKLLADLAGKPVVRWSVEHVLSAAPDEALVVVGSESEAVRTALDGLRVRIVVNDGWAEGIASSIRAGVAALAPTTDATIIALGDQPAIEPAVVARLLDLYAEGRGPIVVPSYRGQMGNPVVFGAEVFSELLTLRGDRGARDLIARNRSRLTVAELDSPPPLDVDTQEELRLMLGRAASWSSLPEGRAPGAPTLGEKTT